MLANRIIKILSYVSIALLMAFFCLFGIIILYYSIPAIIHSGYHFFTDISWIPSENTFGALSFISTTSLSSIIAILIAMPLSLSIAILLEEYYKQGRFNKFIKYSIDILALVPSIIYGYWAWYFLIPLLEPDGLFFGDGFSNIMFISLVLAIMIIPYSASFSFRIISRVSDNIKDAAFSLGASKYRMIMNVLVPNSAKGLWAAMLLAMARCIGETMALIFILGSGSMLFGETNTMTTIITQDFFHLKSHLHLSALAEIGLLLFVITTMINIAGKYIMQKVW